MLGMLGMCAIGMLGMHTITSNYIIRMLGMHAKNIILHQWNVRNIILHDIMSLEG